MNPGFHFYVMKQENPSQMKTRLDGDDVDSIDVVTKNQMEVKTMLDSGYVITTDISTKSKKQ